MELATVTLVDLKKKKVQIAKHLTKEEKVVNWDLAPLGIQQWGSYLAINRDSTFK